MSFLAPIERRRRPVRVLVVDDSPLVRRILSEALNNAHDLEVVGTAPDASVARDKILALRPDVLTLDLEMPNLEGLTFLRALMQFYPLPVVVMSSTAKLGCGLAMDALWLGAVDVCAKPDGPKSLELLVESLPKIVHAAGVSKLRKNGGWLPPQPRLTERQGSRAERKPGVSLPVGQVAHTSLLAIGASTGGTTAIASILQGLPANCPPIVVVQHIAAGFSEAFAARLNQTCRIAVKEAKNGDAVQRGRALVAPGNLHLFVRGKVDAFSVEVSDGPMVCYQRPSVDVLFSSVAASAADSATGVILTGMGSDGAKGLLKMREAGSRTIAQDESSSVVFGMPREAVRIGAACEVLSLSEIPARLLSG